jgi:hypothetical protein
MKMDAKHTQGPWKFDRSKTTHDGEYDYAISAEGVPVLAEAFGRSSDGGRPAAEANARLIAAAPALLEACERLLEELRLIRMKDSGAVYDVTCRIVAEAAISKATTA